MSTIATREPLQLTAGDRWQWERQDLSDYVAPTWVLTYAVSKAGKHITLTATANGGYHLVDVAAATTATYPAGRYTWDAYVTSSTDRQTIGRGEIEVRPNLAAETSGYDSRSFARRTLDDIEAAIEGRATARQLDMVNMQIAQRGLQRDVEALPKLRNIFKAEVNRERISDRLASGMSGAPRLLVRM